MHIRLRSVLLIAVLLTAMSASAQQKEYEGKMLITPLQLEQKGDSLYIKMRFDISGVNVDSHRSISLFPVLITPQHTLPLPEVMVKGRSNYKAYARAIGLMNKKERQNYAFSAPYAVLKGYKSSASNSIEYNKVVPYEAWMEKAKLNIQEDLCGCGNDPRTLAVSQLINGVKLEVLIEPYQVTPTLAYVSPQVEMIKRREMVGEAFLDFVVNKIDIRPEYMNNPRELKKITDMITEVQSNKDISVNSISVIGFASPEGTVDNNKRLSEGRANALVRYLVPRFDYPHSLYNVEYGGENWDGLYKVVQNMEWEYKDDVLDILNNVPIKIDIKRKTSRKKALMDLNGGLPYRYLLKEVFPTLRVAICKIDYVVKGFEVASAKKIITTRPQDLSLNEMFLVANTYEKGSVEFIDLFELAVRIFPSDVTANINAASAALARNDIRSAERYIKRVADSEQIPELVNAQGVLAMLKGEYEQAELLLQTAANAGLEEAKENLAELAKKRQNIEDINKQKRK